MKTRVYQTITKRLLGMCFMVLMVSLFYGFHGLGVTPVRAAPRAVFTVNSTGDGADAIPGDGICQTSIPGECTLRAAIQEADATAGPHTINFDIPNTDAGCVSTGSVYVCTITVGPNTPLPIISQTIAIDASGQPGYNWGTQVGTGGTVGVSNIALSTTPRATIAINFNSNLQGLVVGANNVTIKGLAFYNHLGGGVPNEYGAIETQSGTSGTELTQLLAGALADGSDPGASLRNKSAALAAFGSFYIYNNYIAYNGTGMQIGDNITQPNFTAGVLPATCTLGQTALISNTEFAFNGYSNTGVGLAVYATGVAICQNYLHDTQLNGLLASPLRGEGVKMFYDASFNRIENNTISNNQTAGIGMYHSAANNLVFRNIINNNGDTTSGVGAGISVGDATDGSFPTSPVENHLTQNSTFANVGLSIDLVRTDSFTTTGMADGPTLNAPDPRTGPNNLYNYPVLTSTALSGITLTVSGYSKPGEIIELFIADPDPSGFGEGKTYLTTLPEGSVQDKGDPITPVSYSSSIYGSDTNARSFTFAIDTTTLPASVALGTHLTATGTDTNGNTSEFSYDIDISKPTAVRLENLTARSDANVNWIIIVSGILSVVALSCMYVVSARKR